MFANGGTISDAITSCASTSPRAAAERVTDRGGSGDTASRIRCLRLGERDHGVMPHYRQQCPAGCDELADPFRERGAEIFPVERELDVGAQEVELLADVVAAARRSASRAPSPRRAAARSRR